MYCKALHLRRPVCLDLSIDALCSFDPIGYRECAKLISGRLRLEPKGGELVRHSHSTFYNLLSGLMQIQLVASYEGAFDAKVEESCCLSLRCVCPSRWEI